MNDKLVLTKDECLNEVLKDNILTDEVKKIIVDYFNSEEIHCLLNITFSELFLYVWQRCKDNNEIRVILNSEISDSYGTRGAYLWLCKCFTGRISRLLNCLNGFYPDIQINISNNEQISNIILLLMKKYANNFELLKEEIKKELKERNYSDEIINEWLNYID